MSEVEYEVTKVYSPDNPEYKPQGIFFPFSLWRSDYLTLQEKAFFIEIKCLDNEEGCYASNAHFAKTFGCSKSRATQIIKSLEAKGLIAVRLDKKGKEVVKRVCQISKLGVSFYLTGVCQISKGERSNYIERQIRKEKTPAPKEGAVCPSCRSKKVRPSLQNKELLVCRACSRRFKHPVRPQKQNGKKQDPDRFEEFWQLQIRKIGKQKCRRWWDKHINGNQEEVIEGWKAQIELYKELEIKYVPHPHTWLNRGSWEDDPASIDESADDSWAEGIDFDPE